MKNEILDINEILNKIKKYIECIDYEEITQIKNELINKMQEQYIEYLQNEIGIKNDSVTEYVKGKFDEMSINIKRMLDDRNQRHIDSKTYIIRDEYNKNDEESKQEEIEENSKITEEKIRDDETEINYEIQLEQIISDTLLNLKTSIQNILSRYQLDDSKIEEIGNSLSYKNNKLSNEYSLEFSNILKEFDNKITEFVLQLNRQYIAKLKNEYIEKDNEHDNFVIKYKVENENNQIEEIANKQLYEHEKENSEKDKKIEYSSDRLRDDDIF